MYIFLLYILVIIILRIVEIGPVFCYNFFNRKEDQPYEKSHNFRYPSCQFGCSGGGV